MTAAGFMLRGLDIMAIFIWYLSSSKEELYIKKIGKYTNTNSKRKMKLNLYTLL